MKRINYIAVCYAFVAALFYAINVPFSKILLNGIPPTFMAGLLYLGAGIGVGIMYLFHYKNEKPTERLERKDVPYAIAMVLLDIIAPILLMVGVKIGTSSEASLLGNFEIVATTLVALCVFKENVSNKLWAAIILITLSSVILTYNAEESLRFSYGSILVLGATICWGVENNCTRSISDKSTYQIVTIKGLCCGTSSIIVAAVINEHIQDVKYVPPALILGFVAYGLSIFTYIRAQSTLGAAKTSAYYAVAPFIGALLSFLLLKESLSSAYLVALIVMIAGTILVVTDTLSCSHSHEHTHTITHTHDGLTHTHIITHNHKHNHYYVSDDHNHIHDSNELLNSIGHS